LPIPNVLRSFQNVSINPDSTLRFNFERDSETEGKNREVSHSVALSQRVTFLLFVLFFLIQPQLKLVRLSYAHRHASAERFSFAPETKTDKISVFLSRRADSRPRFIVFARTAWFPFTGEAKRRL
jgi:hypothetical protein